MTTQSHFRVLHVVESYGGGVASAIDEYVTSTPDVEHHILRARRAEALATDASASKFASVADLPSGPRAIGMVRRTIGAVAPSVVHAHSSRAGVYVRLAARCGRRVRIVYTPHCFAFERLNVSRAARAGFYLVERCLAVNTSVIAGCSHHEAALGRRWLGEHRAVYVPNVAQVDHVAPWRVTGPHDAPLLAGMGRVCSQKDPAWFARSVQALRTSVPELRSVWIGGGAPEDEEVLGRSGIVTTSWCDRTRGLRILAGADCYLHSAAWEGFPMSVLEAVALDVPVVIRAIRSVPATPAVATALDPEHAARLVHGVVTDRQHRLANLSAWRSALAENNRATQRERLALAYGGGHRPRRPRGRSRSLAVAVAEGFEQGLRRLSLLHGRAETGNRWT